MFAAVSGRKGEESMDGIQRISCQSMKRDAEQLSEILKDIPETIEELRVSMRKLSQCWEGPAWATFQTQLNKDIQNMLEVYECLVELQKSLGEGRDIYLKTEFDVYTDLKGLWI